MRLINSLWALLGREAANHHAFERIRDAMLEALSTHCGGDHPEVDAAIRFSSSVTELWFRRTDLMHAIASTHSQALAQDVLRRITVLFRGHYRSANQSRFAALA